MENTKICPLCGIEQPFENFGSNKGRKDGLQRICKSCQKKERERRSEYIKEYSQQYRKNNLDKLKQYQEEYRKNHKEEAKSYSEEYRKTHKEEKRLKDKEYQENNKEKIKDNHQKYYQENKKRLQQQHKEYYNKNKDKLRESHTQYEKKRRESDPLYKLRGQIRSAIRKSFERKSFQKAFHTEEIIGCSIDDFIIYLNKTYVENYGIEWDGKTDVHIDHIIPLKTATTEEEVLSLCHYTNLQLLKAEDNLLKKDRLDFQLEVQNESGAKQISEENNGLLS